MTPPTRPGAGSPTPPEIDSPAHPPGSPQPVLTGRLTLRMDDLAATLGVSRRAIERERAAGRFPKPDVTIGRVPLWTLETVRSWLEKGGRA